MAPLVHIFHAKFKIFSSQNFKEIHNNLSYKFLDLNMDYNTRGAIYEFGIASSHFSELRNFAIRNHTSILTVTAFEHISQQSHNQMLSYFVIY